MEELCFIEMPDLIRCPIQLRVVRKKSLEYVMFRDSIQKFGILTPLLVRPSKDRYEVVNGAHRYEAALDLRLPRVPCHVKEMNDLEVLVMQMASHTAVATTTVEYARRLWRIINIDQDMSINELAHSIKWHPDKVKRILNLVNLSEKGKSLLTEGHLDAIIGVELCKLPINTQDQLLNQLDSLSSSEFRDLVTREARHRREGKKDKRRAGNLKANYRLRNIKELINEMTVPVAAASVISAAEATTPLEIWKACIEWTIKSDLASRADDLNRLKREEAREANRLERRIIENKHKEV